MLEPIEVYRHYFAFEKASEVAKHAAVCLQQQTAVRWHMHGWIVLVPLGGSGELNSLECQDIDDYDSTSSVDYRDISNENLDNYTALIEDGWFYRD